MDFKTIENDKNYPFVSLIFSGDQNVISRGDNHNDLIVTRSLKINKMCRNLFGKYMRTKKIRILKNNFEGVSIYFACLNISVSEILSRHNFYNLYLKNIDLVTEHKFENSTVYSFGYHVSERTEKTYIYYKLLNSLKAILTLDRVKNEGKRV